MSSRDRTGTSPRHTATCYHVTKVPYLSHLMTPEEVDEEGCDLWSKSAEKKLISDP